MNFTSNLPTITRGIFTDTTNLKEDGVALSVTKTVRTDASPGTAVDLNGTYGIAGGDLVFVKGFNVLAGSIKVESVSASSAAGSIVTDTSLASGLPQGTSLTFIGSSQTVVLTGAQILITSYPTADVTVYIDLDNIITPGADA